MTWITQRQQRAQERLLEVLDGLASRIEALEARGEELQINERFAELITNVLPDAMGTANESKRQLFAALLANAATESRSGLLDEARTMVGILHSLAYDHVDLLHRLMTMPSSAFGPAFWGRDRWLSVKREALLPSDGPLLLRLQAIGLIELGEFRRLESQEPADAPVLSTELGIALHSWVINAEED